MNTDDNVIAFPLKDDIGFINGIPVQNPKTAVEYLFLCKKFLAIEDYEEVLLSIMDEAYYQEAEPQIKEIVNTYFRY
jgi:hypothetical protein